MADGRWPRAYSLAVLAAEEFGKFYLCVVTGLELESVDAGSWARFWKKFSRHRPKFAAWFGQYVDSQDWGPVGSTGDQAWLRAWNSHSDEALNHDHGKQSGFYADFDIATNEVRTPAELFTEAKAARMISMVASVVNPWAARATGDLTVLVTPTVAHTAFFAELFALKDSPPTDPRVAVQALVSKHFGVSRKEPSEPTAE
jgi:AbiV family abortive infection protein